MNVLDSYVRSPLEECSGFAAKNQVLDSAWTSTPGKLVSNEIGNTISANTCLANNRQCIASNMITEGNFTNTFLEYDDFFCREYGFNFRRIGSCCSLSDFEFFRK